MGGGEAAPGAAAVPRTVGIGLGGLGAAWAGIWGVGGALGPLHWDIWGRRRGWARCPEQSERPH